MVSHSSSNYTQGWSITEIAGVYIYMDGRITVVYLDVSPALAVAYCTHSFFAAFRASSTSHGHETRMITCIKDATYR